jgi:hypothetical protein
MKELAYKNFKNMNFSLKKNILKIYDENEILHFYNQLLKMKKKRTHINPLSILLAIYPNSSIKLIEIIRKHKDSK